MGKIYDVTVKETDVYVIPVEVDNESEAVETALHLLATGDKRQFLNNCDSEATAYEA